MGEATNQVDTSAGRPLFVVGVGASAGGLEALQRLFAKTQPSGALAFLDGFSVASKVREESMANVRLVALTGYGLPQDRARATAAGFDRHILKPVEPSALFRVLHEVSTPTSSRPS
jgi:CheY-like chemotaxis protein